MVQQGLIKDITCKNAKTGRYTIDEYGTLYTKLYKRTRTNTKDKDGYLKTSLATNDNKRICVSVATIVAYTFIGEPPPTMIDPTINHKDSNKLNNHYSNLEWMERSQNSSIRNNKGVGEENHEAKLTTEQVVQICKLLEKQKNTLTEIAKRFNVNKSTISNIKRRKTWKNISKDYDFIIKKVKNKNEQRLQKEEIINYLNNGLPAKEIIKLGYANSVVYRCHKQVNLRA